MAMVVIFVLVMIVVAGVVRRRRSIMLDGIVARHVMTMGVRAEIHVDGGMGAPIRMSPFPIVKSREPIRVAIDPDVAGSEIIICAANNADKFDSVPDISIRNAHFHRYCGRWCHDYYRRRCGHADLNRDYRPCHQWQSRETCDTNRNDNFICSFHAFNQSLKCAAVEFPFFHDKT
jgi:hypothetical protein